MGTALDTKPTSTLAAYVDLEDDEITTSKTAPSCPNCRCSRNSGGDCSPTSPPPKRTLSRTGRAVLFGTILIKRVGERKSNRQKKSDGRKPSLSLDSGSSQVKEDEKPLKRELGGTYKKNSDNHQASLCSLPSASSQSFPIPISDQLRTNGVRQRDSDRRSFYAFNSGVGLLVVSLGVTVMQGKVISILITAMWVYFFAWMHMEDCWLKKKPTKFPETELTGTLRSGWGPPLRVVGRWKNQKKALNL